MSKYFKNFILCGDIDHYCLLCNEYFSLLADIEKHIRWEQHRKKLKSQTTLSKFKKDMVYKVGHYYYCATCNFIQPNLAALTEHVKCEKHVVFKSNPESEVKQPIGLYESGFIIIKNVILSKAQWHLIVDHKCLLCGVKVTDKEIVEHIALADHIIKLIQCETKCVDNQRYRVINEETYHCLICRKTFHPKNFASHLANCNAKTEDKNMKQVKPTRNCATDNRTSVEFEKKLLVTLQKFYKINEKSNIANCKHCNTQVVADYKTMIEHMRMQHDHLNDLDSCSDDFSEDETMFSEVVDHGKKRSELAAYGKMKSIRLNFNGSKGYCTVCDRYLPAHKTIFREHLKGARHTGHLELLGEIKPKVRSAKLNVKLLSISSYINKLQYSAELVSVAINGDFCVNIHSLLLLYAIPDDPHYVQTKCYACNEVFKREDEAKHCFTLKHKNLFDAAKVLAPVKYEFIREVRPNLFHCGHCNQLFPFPENIQRHIQTYNHLLNMKDQKLLTSEDVLWSNIVPSCNIYIKQGNKDLYILLMQHIFQSNSNSLAQLQAQRKYEQNLKLGCALEAIVFT